MSYEAWGDGDESDIPDWYYTSTVETLRADGWLDDVQATALTQRAERAEAALAAERKALDEAESNFNAEKAAFSELHKKYSIAEDTLAQTERDTIERCAKVLENSYGPNGNLKAFAAAIRALAQAAQGAASLTEAEERAVDAAVEEAWSKSPGLVMDAVPAQDAKSAAPTVSARWGLSVSNESPVSASADPLAYRRGMTLREIADAEYQTQAEPLAQPQEQRKGDNDEQDAD